MDKSLREMRGSFFTPQIWSDKSKEYLAAVFSENWQDEYYIWDCAAGTGNLLAGLTNEYNVWASDIEQGNVETMRALADIDENLHLLDAHIFQFDFLNDSFDILPEELRKIIEDKEKRKKLIIYINPPYAEATSKTTPAGTGQNKANVAKTHKTSDRFVRTIGRAINELFAQFFCRIYSDIPGCKLASFSTSKYITSSNFVKFRDFFKVEFKKGFICRSNTFDNVHGEFPICFLIWNLAGTLFPESIELDVIETGTKKTFYSIGRQQFLSDWIRQYYDMEHDAIGYLTLCGTDMQHNQYVNIVSKPAPNDIKKHMVTPITQKNIVRMAMFLAIRHCIDITWINKSDQFLYPHDDWEADVEFQHDCLLFTLFLGHNRISCNDGINHWIPYNVWANDIER